MFFQPKFCVIKLILNNVVEMDINPPKISKILPRYQIIRDEWYRMQKKPFDDERNYTFLDFIL